MIRPYQDDDYLQLYDLYQHGEWYGGTFDQSRDSRVILANSIADDPKSIAVYVKDGTVVGSISLVENKRVAWLYRFVVKDFESVITKELYSWAIAELKQRGHQQVLVYSDHNSQELSDRYKMLGFQQGTSYTCFWQLI